MSRKREGGDDYADWLLSQRGTVSRDIDLDADMSGIRIEILRGAQDTENLQASDTKRSRRK